MQKRPLLLPRELLDTDFDANVRRARHQAEDELVQGWPPWRRQLNALVRRNKAFHRFIYTIIFLNCVLICTANFASVERHRHVLTAIDDTFTALYTVEILVKVLGRGPRRFCKSLWNWLDVLIVLLSLVDVVQRRAFAGGLFGAGAEISASRGLRMLRPLRTITSSGPTRTIVAAVASAAAQLVDVLFLTVTFVFIMSFIALELFEGRLSHRCRDLGTALAVASGNLSIESWNTTDSLVSDSVCVMSYFPREFNVSSPEGEVLLAAAFSRDYSIGRAHGHDAVRSTQQVLKLQLFDERVPSSDPYICPYNTYCVAAPSPERGFTNFDSIMTTLATLYTLTILEGWTFVMYYLMDALGWFVSFYTLPVIIIGSTFILNLALVIISDSFQRSAAIARLRNQSKKMAEAIRVTDQPGAQGSEGAGASSSGAVAYEDAEREVEGEIAVGVSRLFATVRSRAVSILDTSGNNSAAGQASPFEKNEDSHDGDRNSVDVATGAAIEAGSKGNDNTALAPSVKASLHRIRLWVARTITGSFWFNAAIITTIIINAVAMATVHHGMSRAHIHAVFVINVICAAIFATEMILRLIGSPLLPLLKDPMTVLDFVITLAALVELFVSSSSSISVLRCLRLLRLLTTVRPLRRTIKVLVTAIGSTHTLLLLFVVTLFVLALTGMQAFGGRMCGLDTDSAHRVNTSICSDVPRANFDNMGYAFTTVFVTVAGDGWRPMMVLGEEVHGSYSAIYYIAVHFIGGYFLINLFVAVLLNSKEEVPEDYGNDDTYEVERDAEERVILNKLAAAHVSEYYPNGDLDGDAAMSVTQFQEKGRQHETPEVEMAALGSPAEPSPASPMEEPLLGTDTKKEEMGAVKKAKRTRYAGAFWIGGRLAVQITESSVLLWVISLTIALSMVSLVISRPTHHPMHSAEVFGDVVDAICAAVFALEAAINISSYGAFTTAAKRERGFRSGYFQRAWSCFDFALMLISLLPFVLRSAAISRSTYAAVLDWARFTRALRPWSLVGRHQGLRLVFQSLMRSIPALRNASVIVLIVWVVFAVLGTQLWHGKLYACMDNTWGDVTYNSPYLTTKVDCEAAGFEWHTEPANFDNVGNALVTLFQTATISNWHTIMYSATDARDHKSAPGRFVSPWAPVFFMCYIMIQVFFLLNFFVSVLIEAYFRTKGQLEEAIREHHKERLRLAASEAATLAQSDRGFDNANTGASGVVGAPSNADLQAASSKIGRSVLLTEEQEHFFDFYYRVLLFVKPPLVAGYSGSSWRGQLRRVVRHRLFEHSQFVVMLLHIGIQATTHEGESREFALALFILDFLANAFFMAASLMKLAVYGIISFVEQRRNVVDMLINVGTLVGCILFVAGGPLILSRVLMLLRIARLYRVVFVSTGMMVLAHTLVRSARNFLSVFFLLVLFLFAYTVAGMKLFGRVKWNGTRDGLHRFANFDRFDVAMYTLVRVGTLDNWAPLMWNCAIAPPDCDPHLGECGWPIVAPIFFLSFIFVGQWIGMHFFTAVLMDSFAKSEREERYAIQRRDVRRFQKLWKKFSSREGDYHTTMTLVNLQRFIAELGPPIGPDLVDRAQEELSGPADAAAGTNSSPTAAIKAFSQRFLKRIRNKILRRSGHADEITDHTGEEKPSYAAVLRFLRELDIPLYGNRVLQRDVLNALIRHQYAVELPESCDIVLSRLAEKRFRAGQIQRVFGFRLSLSTLLSSSSSPPSSPPSSPQRSGGGCNEDLPPGDAGAASPDADERGGGGGGGGGGGEKHTLATAAVAMMIQARWRGHRMRMVVKAAMERKRREDELQRLRQEGDAAV